MLKPALFLDRDGVINEYRPYVHRVEDFIFMEGVFDLVAETRKAGFLTVVVTNQAGIGRGLYSEEDFWRLMRWVEGRFEERGCRIDGVYFCPYHPEHGVGRYRADSDWRKPKPGMILQAAYDLEIDLAASVMIGDRISDMQAGLAAGVGKNVLIGLPDEPEYSGYVAVPDLRHVMALIKVPSPGGDMEPSGG